MLTDLCSIISRIFKPFFGDYWLKHFSAIFKKGLFVFPKHYLMPWSFPNLTRCSLIKGCQNVRLFPEFLSHFRQLLMDAFLGYIQKRTFRFFQKIGWLRLAYKCDLIKEFDSIKAFDSIQTIELIRVFDSIQACFLKKRLIFKKDRLYLLLNKRIRGKVHEKLENTSRNRVWLPSCRRIDPWGLLEFVFPWVRWTLFMSHFKRP